MNKKINLSVIFLFFLQAFGMSAQEKKPVAYWTFDQVQERMTEEICGKIKDSVQGNFRLVNGVKGKALILDGYTTCVIREAENSPQISPDFTVTAWVALGAYPWNWVPIMAQENTISMNSNMDTYTWPEDIIVNSPRDGFYFGISPEGYLGLHVGADGWMVGLSKNKVPLRQWTHVAAVFRNNVGLELFINGKKEAFLPLEFPLRPAQKEDLRIGMNRQKIEPSHPVRPFATLACWYSLDGILDEVKLYNDVLSPEILTTIYETEKPDESPELPVRIMPSGPEGPGEFGASYERLSYYPEWDALWPVSNDPDVVVRFDNSPVRVVFWRGTRYSPVWVMDKYHWMADQSIENFNDQDGCIEHMLDPRCRFSHVRIIENNEARVVVHWRYCPVSANGNHSQLDPVTGWEDWVDEYYTFYPDQVGIRKVILHTRGHYLWPEEVIVLCHPGQRPEDVVDLKALTLANLKGRAHTYDWTERTPLVSDDEGYLHFGSEQEEKPVILMVNMKSEYKPFQVFETENRVRIFGIEHRKGISHFPWWNHWPVAQIPSDGRYCQAPDRASHFSLAWGGPPPHKGEGNTFWWAWLYGASQGPAESVVPLARSWLRPPEMKLLSEVCKNQGFDPTQRCYVISCVSEDFGDSELKINLLASPEAPLFNPAFLIKGWGNSGVTVRLDGDKVLDTEHYRVGYIRKAGLTDLIIWLEMERESPISILFKKEGPSPTTHPLPRARCL